jgi:hypothetical protein
MTCEEARRLIDAQRDSDELYGHLESCAACGDAVDRILT